MKLKDLMEEETGIEITNDDEWNSAKTNGSKNGVAKAIAVKRKFKIAIGGEQLKNVCENIIEKAKAGAVIMSDEGLSKNCGTYSMSADNFKKKYKIISNPDESGWGLSEKIPGGSVEYILGLDSKTKVKSWNGLISAKESGSYAIRYGNGDYAFVDPKMFRDSYKI